MCTLIHWENFIYSIAHSDIFKLKYLVLQARDSEFQA